MEELAFAVITIAAGVIAIASVLIVGRISRLVDAATETVLILNRLATRVEALVAEAEKEVATVRAITARLGRASERLGGLSEDVVRAIEVVLDPIKRVSRIIGALKGGVAGVIGGNDEPPSRAGARRRAATEDPAEDARSPD